MRVVSKKKVDSPLANLDRPIGSKTTLTLTPALLISPRHFATSLADDDNCYLTL